MGGIPAAIIGVGVLTGIWKLIDNESVKSDVRKLEREAERLQREIDKRMQEFHDLRKQNKEAAEKKLKVIKELEKERNKLLKERDDLELEYIGIKVKGIKSQNPIDNVTYEDVIGLENVDTDFVKTLGGMLTYGPPGCGKTLIARVIASKPGIEHITVSPKQILSEKTEISLQMIRVAANLAVEYQPCVLFFDEFDAMFAGNPKRVKMITTELKAQMKLLHMNNTGVSFIAMTNRPWAIDSEVRQLFLSQIHIPIPTESNRQKYLEKYGKKLLKKCEPGSMEYLARHTQRYSYRELHNVLDALETERVASAMGDFDGNSRDAAVAAARVTREMMVTVLENVRPNTSKEAVQCYEKYAEIVNGKMPEEELPPYCKRI